MGAVFAPTRFSSVRLCIRDLVAEEILTKEFWGVGGGGQNRILIPVVKKFVRFCLVWPALTKLTQTDSN